MYEGVDPRRAAIAEDLDLVARQLVLGEDAVPDRVVDVVVDVRNPVDDSDDLPLEGFGLPLARVGEDAVSHLVREVEPFCDAQ